MRRSTRDSKPSSRLQAANESISLAPFRQGSASSRKDSSHATTGRTVASNIEPVKAFIAVTPPIEAVKAKVG